jgi:hypothetical protein
MSSARRRSSNDRCPALAASGRTLASRLPARHRATPDAPRAALRRGECELATERQAVADADGEPLRDVEAVADRGARDHAADLDLAARS